MSFNPCKERLWVIFLSGVFILATHPVEARIRAIPVPDTLLSDITSCNKKTRIAIKKAQRNWGVFEFNCDGRSVSIVRIPAETRIAKNSVEFILENLKLFSLHKTDLKISKSGHQIFQIWKGVPTDRGMISHIFFLPDMIYIRREDTSTWEISNEPTVTRETAIRKAVQCDKKMQRLGIFERIKLMMDPIKREPRRVIRGKIEAELLVSAPSIRHGDKYSISCGNIAAPILIWQIKNRFGGQLILNAQEGVFCPRDSCTSKSSRL